MAEPDLLDVKIKWSKKAESYDAALEKLTPLLGADHAAQVVDKLKKAELTQETAADLFKDSYRQPIPLANHGVVKHLLNVSEGNKLPPILLIRFDDGSQFIADGHHRASLAFHIDPFIKVPLKLAHV